MSPQTSGVAESGIGVVTSLFSAMGQIDAGKNEEKAFDYNADIDLQNTANAIVSNEQRYSTLIGKQATAYAAAGVDITSGSPLLMMAATAGRGGKQADQLLESGTEQSNLERYYGKVAAWRGKLQGIGTFLGGLNNFAKTISGTYGQSNGSTSSGNIPTTASPVF